MNFIKYRFISFIFSSLLILASIYGLVRFGLVLGVDFIGGSLVEVLPGREQNPDQVRKNLEENGLSVSQIQQTGVGSLLIRFEGGWKEKDQVVAFFQNRGGQVLRDETVGPTFGKELFKKALLAIGLTIILILAFIAWRFGDLNFGLIAVIAMVHDNLILLGIFSFLGRFLAAPVDSLFITAALTTLATSVYDTVVTFGYIRDQLKQSFHSSDIEKTANEAIGATVVRNINNSWTIIFMLVAILLLGGETITWFAVALLVGTILGTYSSTLLAVPLLVVWQKVRQK
ncbi:MAG: protein translocase subunit SecF [Candidatus Shapirobacteria bacterium]|nr:protein translocase subunit SecF [Candidatus Shapirobacteria bacterium]MDD5481610.1 protein translocase subunit SecF [Candidatus Shapirobacteria bacterium]